VGDAGDKAADVFLSGERRHGFAEGLVGVFSGVVGFLSFFECRVVGAFPRGAGADNGGVLGMAGADSSGRKLDSSVMWVLLARQIRADSDFIVRGGKGIICKVEWGIVIFRPFR